MDPFTAIGLAGNIVAFVDFGLTALKAAREVHASPTASTTSNARLESLTTRGRELAVHLHAAKPAAQMSADELRLQELADECVRVADELLLLLDRLKAVNPKSKRAVVGAVWKNICRRDEREALEKRLEQCHQQLHLQLSQRSRFETVRRLDVVIQSGICQQHELASLNSNIEVLRQGVEVTSLGPDVTDQLKSLLDLSTSAVDSAVQHILLKALRFEGMESRFDDVLDAHAHTFRWIFSLDSSTDAPSSNADLASMAGSFSDSNSDSGSETVSSSAASSISSVSSGSDLRQQAAQNFVEWLETGQGIFHVSGKPGAGKSTLMKYLCSETATRKLLQKWAGAKELVFASFFFWKPGNELQKSLKGLIRSLLHSILSQCPQLLGVVFPKQWGHAQKHHTAHFSHQDIQDAFKIVISRQEIYASRKFIFFIDGLDEFVGDHTLIIKSFFSWVAFSPSNIKICLSSREWLIFQERFALCPKLRLHELTSSDIDTLLRDRLEANEDFQARPDHGEIRELRNQLVKQSEGVFLWAELALRTLEKGLLAGDTIEDLHAKIDCLPPELDDLFQAIFDSIIRSNRVECRKALRMMSALSSMLQLRIDSNNVSLFWFSSFDEFELDPCFSDTGRYTLLDQEDTDTVYQRTRKQFYSRCHGLVHVHRHPTAVHPMRRYTVGFIHRAISEFLATKHVQACMAEAMENFDLFAFASQAMVVEIKQLISIPKLSRLTGNVEDDDVLSPYFAARDAWPWGLNPFAADISLLLEIHYKSHSNMRLLFKALDALAQTVNERTSPRILVHRYMSLTVAGARAAMHPANTVYFLAAQFGLYEYFEARFDRIHLTRYEMDDLRPPEIAFYEVIRQLVRLRRTQAWDLGTHNSSRLLRTLMFCFDRGLSPNDCVNDRFDQPSMTIWDLVLWNLIFTRDVLRRLDILEICLAYGADANHLFRFEAPVYVSYNLTGRHYPVQVEVKSGSRWLWPNSRLTFVREKDVVVERARTLHGDSTLTLRDIMVFWQPHAARDLRELVDRSLFRKGGIDTEEITKLKQQYETEARGERSDEILTPALFSGYKFETRDLST